MAWHMKLKLPKFKLSQRSASGDRTSEILVPRGRRIPVANPGQGNDYEMEGKDVDSSINSSLCDNISDEAPSLHSIKQKSNVSA